MRWRCQAFRGMDTYRSAIVVEADTEEEAAAKAMALTPFGDVMVVEEVEEDEDEDE